MRLAYRMTQNDEKSRFTDEFIKETIASLFEEAKNNGGIQYLFTILRVTGLTRQTDPLIKLRQEMNEFNEGAENTSEGFAKINQNREFLKLIYNLSSCVSTKQFKVEPFISLNKGQFPKITYPSFNEVVEFTLKNIQESNLKNLLNLAEHFFNPASPQTPQAYFNFLRIFLDHYEFILKRFVGEQPFTPNKHFEVTELLIDENNGLYGFNVHHSNGGKSTFTRKNDATDCINLTIDDGVGVFVGPIDELKHEWMVNGEPLYKTGIRERRYNKWGEWKPIVHPGKLDFPDKCQEEIRKLSANRAVQGCLFYIMTTGHWAIEFVVKTRIFLPREHVALGDKGQFILFKCKPIEGQPNTYEQIYDGTLFVSSIEPESIEQYLAIIDIAINRLAFAYNAPVRWRLKYRLEGNFKAMATPSEEDLDLLDKHWRNFPESTDLMIMDEAIDWFNRGNISDLPLIKYLCYFNSLEKIATAVAENKIPTGSGSEPKEEQDKQKCIQETLEKLLESDPEKAIQTAYFECVKGVTHKIKTGIKKIFGDNHKYNDILFKKQDGYSLVDIRGRIAHADFAHLDNEAVSIAIDRLPQIHSIARELLHRVMFNLKIDETLPGWSGKHKAGVSFSDPNATFITNNEKQISAQDWKIKSEWCD